MNVYSVALTPPGLRVETQAGNAVAAVKNALYFHGRRWNAAKHDGQTISCSYLSPSVHCYPTLTMAQDLIAKVASGETVVERDYHCGADEDHPRFPIGNVYELASRGRRSGIVVRLLDWDCETRIVRGTWDYPGDEEGTEKLTLRLLAEFCLWPWKALYDIENRTSPMDG